MSIGALSALSHANIGRRLALYYFFYFSAIGVLEPYLNLYFRHLGFSGRQIGLLSGLPGLVFATFPFFWTALADARRRRNEVFVLTTWAASLSFFLLLCTDHFWALLLINLLLCTFRSP